LIGLLALAAPVAWGNSRPLAGLPLALVVVAVLALSHALYSARSAITPFLLADRRDARREGDYPLRP
jgi:hypothetical protein